MNYHVIHVWWIRYLFKYQRYFTIGIESKRDAILMKSLFKGILKNLLLTLTLLFQYISQLVRYSSDCAQYSDPYRLKNYSNKDILFLGWSNRYTISTKPGKWALLFTIGIESKRDAILMKSLFKGISQFIKKK
jgi:hypothetical protein